jgi:hypothetical protein
VISTRRNKDAYSDRNITIASSSIDGLVCAVPLFPSASPPPGQSPSTAPYTKSEITLKNFKRPVLAVALSPNFRTDRTFLSGGLAGNLILSVAPPGGGNNVTSWMSLGLAAGPKDIILHSGEGIISAIAWSKESPRYVAWVNEQGVKIMRSHIVPPAALQKNSPEDLSSNPGMIGWIPGLGSSISGKPAHEVAWKRISAIERPDSIPEELASLHKPRLEWIDRRTLLTSEPGGASTGGTLNVQDIDWGDKEKLVIGWGGTVWIVDVFPGSEKTGEEDNIGWAQITHMFQTDCTIAGIHMYTPSLLLVLAYLTNSNDPQDTSSAPSSPLSPSAQESPGPASRGSSGAEASSRFRRCRANALTPELRFIDISTSEEVSADELMMNRFDSLAVGDYHLSVLPATPSSVKITGSSESIAGFGAGLWAAASAPSYLFSSAHSVRSFGSDSRRNSFTASGGSGGTTTSRGKERAVDKEIRWGEDEKGTKIYVTSPYDVVFATERSQKDHLEWMMERDMYAEAWQLIDRHPEVVDADKAELSLYDEEERKVVEIDYESDCTSLSGSKHCGSGRRRYSTSEKEKRRIGELWIRSLIHAGEWGKAAEVCGKVLGTSTRWENWVWVFEAEGRIREITPYIPTTQLSPPLPNVIYEIVLAYYLNHDLEEFRQLLLERWKPEGARTLYDARTITDTIILKLDNREANIKPGDVAWRLLQECLAKLYMALSEPRNALKRYIVLKDSDEAFRLIREYRLVDAIRDDVISLILLRVTPEQLKSAPIPELEEATREAITLLTSEADRGIVTPHKVVSQLDSDETPASRVFLFFYLRRLWQSSAYTVNPSSSLTVGGPLADFGDLMVELFAEYDRPLLLDFLKDSHSYSLSKASQVCEQREYIPELVHLLSKTGQTKRALFLIIEKLADVARAISFAKAEDDPDLWSDLLDYSMDKPQFIRGLLENVGTAIDPITLVRRIPAGLEIEGLKDAVGRILREYAVQWSICDGVAKAMDSEVSYGMDRLRGGRRRGVKFCTFPSINLAAPEAETEEKTDEDEEKREHENPSDACGVCHIHFVGTGMYPVSISLHKKKLTFFFNYRKIFITILRLRTCIPPTLRHTEFSRLRFSGNRSK